MTPWIQSKWEKVQFLAVLVLVLYVKIRQNCLNFLSLNLSKKKLGIPKIEFNNDFR